MDAHIGDGVQPVAGRGTDGTKIRDIETGKEVFFNITHPVLHPAFFIALADIARCNAKAVVVGKIKVFGVQYRGLSDNAS